MNISSDLVSLLLVGLVVSSLPMIAVVATSYTKIVIVLNLLRNALGVQQVPPNMVLNAIAIILSCYVLEPVGMAAFEAGKLQQGNDSAVETVLEGFRAMSKPYGAFLDKHAHTREKAFFQQSARAMWPKERADALKPDDLIVLVPAFMLTELSDAFRIGFLLYIVFVVIDLVIANVLMSMGLNQITPATISTPFKLLLFVMLDGWSVLLHGLVLTYR